MPKPMDVDRVIRVARAAGEVIQEVRLSSSFAIADKGKDGPVTVADYRSDILLRNELGSLANAAWLSEESVDDAARFTSDRVWIVDPLDGTKEFIAGIPEYAVAIALVESGQPVLAVIHNPATSETFSAELGSGAWSGDHRLHARDDTTLLTSRSEMKMGEFAGFAHAGFQLRAIGSIAYKLALVASGRAAVTLSRGPKWEWDVCAGSLLVREAGGLVADINGAPLSFNQRHPKTPGILAGSKPSFERAQSFVRTIGPSKRMAELGKDRYFDPGPSRA